VGTKPSNNYQSDRPESGGADRNSERESSGILDRDKQKFASDKAAERESSRPTGADDRGGSRDGESAE
jgi:hypothetical protein